VVGGYGVWQQWLESDGSSSSGRYSTGWQQRCEHSVHGSSVWQEWLESDGSSSNGWYSTGWLQRCEHKSFSYATPNVLYCSICPTPTHTRVHFPLFHKDVSECASFRHGNNRHGCFVSSMHIGDRST